MGCLFALDQFTKWFVEKSIRLNESLSIINNFFFVTHTVNEGWANQLFSPRPGQDARWTIVYIPLGVLFIFSFLFIYFRFRNSTILERLGSCFIFSGAASNIWSNFNQNWVIDIFSTCRNIYICKAFNFADLWIFIGLIFVVSALISELIQGSQPSRENLRIH
jgi:signal peptidase II